jgi:hypothetical protein
MAYDVQIGPETFDLASIQGMKELREAEVTEGYPILFALLNEAACDSSNQLAEEIDDLLDLEGDISRTNRKTLKELLRNLQSVEGDIEVVVTDGLGPEIDDDSENWVVTPDDE